MLQHNNWHFAHALRPGRPKARLTSNNAAVRPNENWIYEAEFPDGGGELRHLRGGVRARVADGAASVGKGRGIGGRPSRLRRSTMEAGTRQWPPGGGSAARTRFSHKMRMEIGRAHG